MGRNDNTWSDRHRSAIGYAQAELGMSSSKAVEAGMRGELGLPPFEMPDSTAREIKQAYERGDIEPPNVEDHAHALARRLQTLIDKRFGQLAANPNTPHYEYKRLAEMQIAALAMAGKRAPQKPLRTKPHTDPNGQETTAGLIAALLQDTGTDTKEESETGSG